MWATARGGTIGQVAKRPRLARIRRRLAGFAAVGSCPALPPQPLARYRSTAGLEAAFQVLGATGPGGLESAPLSAATATGPLAFTCLVRCSHHFSLILVPDVSVLCPMQSAQLVILRCSWHSGRQWARGEPRGVA